jgi:hypothetical protein
MHRPCEVCESLSKKNPDLERPTRVRRVLVADRIVALCALHADQLRRSGARDEQDLCEVFTEPDGRRSLVGRRSPLDRRVFPPRPEGRRCGPGRSHDDARE